MVFSGEIYENKTSFSQLEQGLLMLSFYLKVLQLHLHILPVYTVDSRYCHIGPEPIRRLYPFQLEKDHVHFVSR